MDPLPTFLLRVAKGAARPVGGREKMVIIVRRPYGYLAEELSQVFEGQEDVHVIVDRRHRERRTRWEPVTVETRQTDRRKPREEILEVALTTYGP